MLLRQKYIIIMQLHFKWRDTEKAQLKMSIIMVLNNQNHYVFEKSISDISIVDHAVF